MSDRLDRLIQLLKIKQEATQQAYIELVKAREQFNQNKARHEQLVGYRQDYLQQLEVLGQQGSYVGPLRNRINFINHLDTALVQLNSYLSQLAKNRMKADLNYKQAKISEEGISKLIERVKRAELNQLQRIEQKETDEYAQKQWYSSLKHDR
ncbi:TPA: flagellar export protein FliJ [Legionella pneumophila]|nr:flagellar export protein FliJ [Legionella pneumophila]HAT8866955.1 flagellar export protein FliJ [Legionella pneumophila subsp. pneumophila]HAT8932143.1 flagellar export protein FliJ [Legionella pneumophila subsp. pneumophila]HAU0161872.1 flagellar export protein FliJ [Legionella pneumophila]HCJ1100245.1 flagellar export protein FliJ [Legionella pneumophila]